MASGTVAPTLAAQHTQWIKQQVSSKAAEHKRVGDDLPLTKVDRVLVLGIVECQLGDDDCFSREHEATHTLLMDMWELVTRWLMSVRQGGVETLLDFLLQKCGPKKTGGYRALQALAGRKVDIGRQEAMLREHDGCKQAVNKIIDANTTVEAVGQVAHVASGWLDAWL